MQHVLIFGATSAIAVETARAFAKEGAAFYLVARNEAALGDLAADLKVRGAASVETQSADLADLDRLPLLCEAAVGSLGRIDFALIAHGVLPDQSACEKSAREMLETMRVNAMSPAMLMTEIASALDEQGGGTLAVISSVAGDRGRPSNYIYGASKALLSVLGEGMALKFAGSAVRVITVKPGFVDTPMTAAFPKGALWSSAEAVGQAIFAAAKAGRSGVLYVPFWWRFIMLVIKFAPGALVKRL